MNVLSKYFDGIYCINLDSRKDRWEQCLTEFNKLGISDIVQRYAGIKMKPGIAGCTKSHIELIKLAKERNLNNVLIFEDDFEIANDEFVDILEKSFEQLNSKGLEYDLLYLGGNARGGELNNLIDTNLARLKQCKTTHAYAINSRIFDFILNKFENVNWADETNWMNSNDNRLSIDIWYINNIQCLGNSYGTFPCLVDQRISHSDIMGYEIYHNVLQEYNKNVIKL